MSHNAYVLIKGQIVAKKFAECSVEGTSLFVQEDPSQSIWTFSSKVFDAEEGALPSAIGQGLTKSGSLIWQQKGAYLQQDPESGNVYLIQKISPCTQYTVFRYVLRDFVSLAKEWKEMIREFSQREKSLLLSG